MMLRHIHKVGASFYVAWGVVRITEGALILAALRVSGGLAVLHMIGSGLGPGRQVVASHEIIDAMLGIYGWTSVGLGILVVSVAARLNWRNSLVGFWLSLGIMATADLGLLFFLVAPGVTYVWEVTLGPVVWITGLILMTIARHPTVAKIIAEST